MLALAIIARVVVFALGAALVLRTLLSAVRTFVVPRSIRDGISSTVFRGMRRLFDLRLKHTRSYEERDGVLALFAPISLLALPTVWLTLVLIGYMGIFWALGVAQWRTAFLVSGSSLFTLGFASVSGLLTTVLVFSEATIGLALLALLISYLPTMYAAFERREAAVTMLEVRAGSPPNAVEMITRYYRIAGLERMAEVWPAWEVWFADVGESHTSLAALSFFRSPHPRHSWVTAAGTVLDTAALMVSIVDVPHDPQADLCLRAGYLALRDIADFFQIKHNTRPDPGDPISITRAEFEAACDQLAAAGVPLKADRDRAWRDFAGWRVNYDTVLLGLARLTMAPRSPWTSDRAPLPAPARSPSLNRAAVEPAGAEVIGRDSL